MKTLILSFLFIFTFLTSVSQTTTDNIIFLDSIYKIVSEQDYFYKKIVRNYNEVRPTYTIEYFYKSGQLKQVGTSSNKDFEVYEGLVTSYFENGNIHEKIIYKENMPTSVYKSWYENGKKRDEGLYIVNPTNEKENILRINQYWDEDEIQQVINGEGNYVQGNENFTLKGTLKNGLKSGEWQGKSTKSQLTFSENYVEGKLISGISIDKDGNKHNYSQIEQRPTPKKGMTHFYEFVANRFNIKGDYKGRAKIILRFIVDKNSEIDDIEVVKGVSPKLDKEAIRVLKAYEKWQPGKQRGVNVNVLYSLPITLDL